MSVGFFPFRSSTILSKSPASSEEASSVPVSSPASLFSAYPSTDHFSAKKRNLLSGRTEPPQGQQRLGEQPGTFPGAPPTLQPQLHISGTGGVKRKRTEFTGDTMSCQYQPITDEDNDYFASISAEPKSKRRYEDRMSTKLGGIQLRDDNERNGTLRNGGDGPLIEEISDWEDDLLDDNSDQWREESADSAVPIVEEPDDGTDQKREKSPTSSQWNSEKTELNEGEQSEEGKEQQKIVLSAELRDLITAMNLNQGITQTEKSIRTGKELILYTPSFLTTPITDQRLDQRKSDDPSMEKEFEEENIDEEILPDSSETAQIQQEKAWLLSQPVEAIFSGGVDGEEMELD